MRLTVGSIINNPRVLASIGGLCPGDPRALAWLNEAEAMMLSYGRWWGSIQRAQFCVSEGCFSFGPEIETVEQIAVNGQPIGIVTNWYAFTQTLASVKQCACSTGCGSSLRYPCNHLYVEDHGTAVSDTVTKGSNKVLRFYPQTADVGKKIIVQGYDSNNIWVRTSIGGSISDGEEITLALPFTDTVTVWYPGSPTGIIKDETDYRVLMHSYDTSTTLEVLLATYQPWETLPTRRKFFMPYFSSVPGNSCCSSTTPKTVTAIVKLAHTPLVNTNDWLLFENANAYKAALMAMKAQEEGFADRFNYYFFGVAASPASNRGPYRALSRGGAIPLLRAELRSKTGDRTDAFVIREATNSLPYSLAGFI